jgi:hypothetical protein
MTTDDATRRKAQITLDAIALIDDIRTNAGRQVPDMLGTFEFAELAILAADLATIAALAINETDQRRKIQRIGNLARLAEAAAQVSE